MAITVNKYIKTGFDCVKTDGEFSLLLSKGVAWNSQFLTSITSCVPTGFLVRGGDDLIPCGSFSWDRDEKQWCALIATAQGRRVPVLPHQGLLASYLDCVDVLWRNRELVLPS